MSRNSSIFRIFWNLESDIFFGDQIIDLFYY